MIPAHCRARAVWCVRYLRSTRQQWSRILFTEESTSLLPSTDDGSPRRVWHRVSSVSASLAKRCSGGRSLWRRISNGVRRHPPQRQNTPLRHPGLPDCTGTKSCAPSSNLLCKPWDLVLVWTTPPLHTGLGSSQHFTRSPAGRPGDFLVRVRPPPMSGISGLSV